MYRKKMILESLTSSKKCSDYAMVLDIRTDVWFVFGATDTAQTKQMDGMFFQKNEKGWDVMYDPKKYIVQVFSEIPIGKDISKETERSAHKIIAGKTEVLSLQPRSDYERAWRYFEIHTKEKAKEAGQKVSQYTEENKMTADDFAKWLRYAERPEGADTYEQYEGYCFLEVLVEEIQYGLHPFVWPDETSVGEFDWADIVPVKEWYVSKK